MSRDEIVAIFDDARAGAYDGQFHHLEAMRDALMLGVCVVLGELPVRARLLCVGVGTGTELVAMAREFPRWSFTAVEPAPAMMAHCRRKVIEAGFAERCTFHEGYLETLPDAAPFDAATCLLVSHFFRKPDARRDFLAGIGRRLGPGGLFVNQDLSWPSAKVDQDSVMRTWVRLMRRSGAEVDRAAYSEALSRAVGILSPPGMERLLLDSGFEDPVHFNRMMMIGAWASRWTGG